MKNIKLERLKDDYLEQVYGGKFASTFFGVLAASSVVMCAKYAYDVANQFKYGERHENEEPSIYNDLVGRGVEIVSKSSISTLDTLDRSCKKNNNKV